MKKLILFVASFLLTRTVFADEYHSLAVDAVSKFSQVGKKSCAALGSKVELIDATSRENGSHVEASYKLKLEGLTYKVKIIDGSVNSVEVIDYGIGG